jgi:hypothetical protein
MSPMGTIPPCWTRQEWQKVLFTDDWQFLSHQGWWSDSHLLSKEWVLHRCLYSGAGSRCRVRHGLGRCVTASSPWACHYWQSQHCATGKTSSLMWYRSCRLILTWPSSMTMPPRTEWAVWMISCKTGMSVFCHGQQRAWISITLSTPGTCWIGLRPPTHGNVRELAGALVEEWGNISQQELAYLVQSMRRRCTAVLNALILPSPLFSLSQLLNLMFL